MVGGRSYIGDVGGEGTEGAFHPYGPGAEIAVTEAPVDRTQIK